MSLFTAQRMTIKKNVVVKSGRQPVSGYELIRVDENDQNSLPLVIPCRITGTNEGNLKLFVYRTYYDLIPGGLHKNFQITIEGLDQTYIISKEPIWAGGVKHHIEVDLEEVK